MSAVYSLSSSYGGVAYNCNLSGDYSVCPTTEPLCQRCLECAQKAGYNEYYIPISPKKATSTTKPLANFGYGSAVALNGVGLAGPDPASNLIAQNNPAPLDWCGGHSTLAYTYVSDPPTLPPPLPPPPSGIHAMHEHIYPPPYLDPIAIEVKSCA